MFRDVFHPGTALFPFDIPILFLKEQIMLTVTDANEFFSSHPAKESFTSFTEEQQANAIAGAVRDITAVLSLTDFPEEPDEMLQAAIFEHTLYLLLNPHIAAAASPEIPLIAPRAKFFLEALAARHCPLPGVPVQRG